jgi:hypothetical protein
MNAAASRYTSTDAQGRFTFRPVVPGAYSLSVNDVVLNEETGERRIVPVPGAFDTRQIVVQYPSSGFAPLELKAVEHVVVSLQYVDSAGKPRGGHPFLLAAKRGDRHILPMGRPDSSGLAKLYVPKGLAEARIELMTDAYSALRWRRGAGGELEPRQFTGEAAFHVQLGTLDADVNDLFIVRYEAPVLVVRAVDTDGKPVPKYTPLLRYPSFNPQPAGNPTRNGGDVQVERQDEGSWRTEQLQPDVELSVSATAEGYKATPQTVTLKEKEVREVTVRMAKE